MQIGNSFNNAIPNFINKNEEASNSILEKIAATRELSGVDSADLIIADQLNSQISTASQELQNTNESIAMLQIADGALQNISDNTLKMEELSVRYNSAALNNDQKSMISVEFQATQESIENIAAGTMYNGLNLFGSESPLGLGSVEVGEASIGDGESLRTLSEQVADLRSEIGSAAQSAEVGVNNLLASISNTTAAYAQISEIPLDEKINALAINETKLEASVLAQNHQTELLKNQMSVLLG